MEYSIVNESQSRENFDNIKVINNYNKEIVDTYNKSFIPDILYHILHLLFCIMHYSSFFYCYCFDCYSFSFTG